MRKFAMRRARGGETGAGTAEPASPDKRRPKREARGEAPSPDPEYSGSNGAAKALEEYGATAVIPVRSNIHCLTIIGQIEGHMVLPPQNKTTKYEHVLPQLVAVEQSEEIEGLLILLNTVGGDVEAGLAIAEVIRTLSKPTVSIVLGGGHSIGVPIAVAADYSFISPTATMTVHPIRMSGVMIGVPQSCDYLAKMQDRIVKFVVQNSKTTEQRYRDLMFRTGELARDVGTILVGQEAVREGLIDEVGGVKEALDRLRSMISQKPRPGKEKTREAGGCGDPVHHSAH